MATSHYRAFISYSHQDEAWARWLQRALESYRIPKRLVGTAGEFGTIPRRLRPIFRDREDLSSASDLTGRIKQELAASETLIVLCSPAAARSRWVEEEIRYFRRLGRGDRILALVVAGDPQAEDPERACFPAALLRHADGSAREPLAADARKYADGRALARLKLVAGMLGIRLDELRRRDAQRRNRQRLGWTAATLATAVLIGWLAWSAVTTQEAVRVQRANTEELLSFMLGDLKRLDPIVGLELVDEDDEELNRYRAELHFDALTDDALVKAALDWREQGIAHHQRGELEPAMRRFQQSRAALVELHRREGSTHRALFELGQAEFWVGYVHMDRGELDEAQASFARYGAVTRRLINADPNDAGMVQELAYSLTNLGAIEQARQNPDTGKILQLFQSAVQYNQMALVLDPGNETYRQDLARILRFLADAWLDACDLGNAFSLQSQSVALLRELSQGLPDDEDRQRELAYALSGLASVQRQMGLVTLADASLAESGALLSRLHERHPENATLHWQALLRVQRRARLARAEGRFDDAWALVLPLTTQVDAVVARAAPSDVLLRVEAAQFRTDYALLALQRGLEDEGRSSLDDAVHDLAALVREKPRYRESLHQLARSVVAYWRANGHLPAGGADDLLRGYLAGDPAGGNCSDADVAARLALVRGDPARARDYTRYVLGKGYFEPDFVSFCRAYALCDGMPDEPAPPDTNAAETAAVDPR